jgi:hypothetical protein
MLVDINTAADALCCTPRQVRHLIDDEELNGAYNGGDETPDHVTLLSLLRCFARKEYPIRRAITEAPDGDPFATTPPADAMAPADLAAALKDMDAREDVCERHHRERMEATERNNREYMQAYDRRCSEQATTLRETAEATRDIAAAIREGTECERKAREDAAARSYSAGFAAGRKSCEREGPAVLMRAMTEDEKEAVRQAMAKVAKDAPPKLPTDRLDALPVLYLDEGPPGGWMLVRKDDALKARENKLRLADAQQFAAGIVTKHGLAPRLEAEIVTVVTGIDGESVQFAAFDGIPERTVPRDEALRELITALADPANRVPMGEFAAGRSAVGSEDAEIEAAARNMAGLPPAQAK